jgi:hypothetical protein
MSRVVLFLVALLGVLLIPGVTAAQEVAEPGVTAVQYFKCQDTATFDRVVETAWLPHVRAAIGEGRVLGWGQLNHFWGDEWNRILYNNATDIQTFHAAFQQIFEAAWSSHPEMMQELEQACSEHKDNIYSVARFLPIP